MARQAGAAGRSETESGRETGLQADRRTLIQRGLLLAGVAVGARVVTAPATAQAAPLPAVSTPETTEWAVTGRMVHMASQDMARGRLAKRDDRSAVYGELVDPASGEKLGEFYSTQIWANTPFGWGPQAARTIESHTFNFADGSLVGQGTALGESGEFAIVGGTGRFLGARGSYTAAQSVSGQGGNGSAEFRFTLLNQG